VDSVRICATFRSRLSAFRGSIAYFAVFLTCSSLLSQGSAGRILRSITDPTGAVIPGVTVTIRDVDRGTTRTLVTDEAGLYLFRSMPFYNWDLSVTKATKFKERYTAQFRAEFFNVLNHPNISNPFGGPGGDNTFTDPSGTGGTSFGFRPQTPDVTSSNPVLGSGGHRAMQLGLKIIF